MIQGLKFYASKGAAFVQRSYPIVLRGLDQAYEVGLRYLGGPAVATYAYLKTSTSRLFTAVSPYRE